MTFMVRVAQLLTDVNLPFGWRVGVEASPAQEYSLRVICDDGVDATTGRPMAWRGRHWRLSQFMTDGEVIQTAFLAVLTASEHEIRETFLYKGQPVFGPHYDIDKLVELCGQPDGIKERPAKETPC